MGYGWEGKLIRLVPLDVDRHLANAQLWINDPEATEFLMAGDFPMTLLAERTWFDKASENTLNSITLAIETLGGKHIGFNSIDSINWRDGTAITGTFIGDCSAQGKGFGTDATNVRSYIAFHVQGLRMLYSSVFSGNVRSQKMLERAGYRVYGIKPASHWKRGRYVDETLLALSREDWLAAQ